MRIVVVTPVPRGSRRGNRVTAQRYAALFRELGHRAVVVEEFIDEPCDLLVALHARKSSRSVARFARRHPGRAIVVVMTGTDLYQDLPGSETARESLRLATRVVLLQPDGARYLPDFARGKARAIVQSCPTPKRPPERGGARFEVSVIGHLRPVKDPFRTALAARRLPEASRIRVTQLGAALSESMERRARAEEACNGRYRWLGDVPRARAMSLLARSDITVVSSKLEGGPNVVSEAIAVGTPVVATRISGVIGMLGADYPGYFEVGDTDALVRLLHRAEMDRVFYARLAAHCERLRPLVQPGRESAAWHALLEEVTRSPSPLAPG